MSGLPLHWVLYSTHVPTGPTNLIWALHVSLPGWAHSLEGGPNRLGVACGHFSREFDVGRLGTSCLGKCRVCEICCGDLVEVQLEKTSNAKAVLGCIPG